MASLLHHMQPWMQKPIAQAKGYIKKMVAQQTMQKVQTIH